MEIGCGIDGKHLVQSIRVVRGITMHKAEETLSWFNARQVPRTKRCE
jgi:P pilus assembly chaperone PapD